MTSFTLTMEVPDAGDHSPRAHRHAVGQFLAAVTQQIGSTEALEGVITHNEPFKQTPIGLWRFLDGENEENRS